MTLALRYAARSHIGLVRSGNEDSGYAAPTMLVVADGMGGHAAGELASAAAVATFAQIDTESDHFDETDALTELAAGVTRTTAEIRRVVADRPQLAGMGTTLTSLVWREGLINVAHVGDSRAYLLRDGELSQMTHDHTYVQMLVDTGRITPDEALTHQRRNLLLRAIDGVNDVEPDLQAREARIGDRYMLCSDGLCGVISESAIATILAEGDPTHAVTALVDAALEAGAPDNVTVVVADVVDVTSADAALVTTQAPVVVGAASETRTRERLASVDFPDDVEPALRADGGSTVITEPVELWADASDHRAAKGRRWWPWFAAVAVGLAAITAAVWFSASSLFFVGQLNDDVVIYQGRPDSRLSRIYETTDLKVNSLNESALSTLANPVTGDLAHAHAVVDNMRRNTVNPTPAVSPTPLVTPTPTFAPTSAPVTSGSIN